MDAASEKEDLRSDFDEQAHWGGDYEDADEYYDERTGAYGGGHGMGHAIGHGGHGGGRAGRGAHGRCGWHSRNESPALAEKTRLLPTLAETTCLLMPNRLALFGHLASLTRAVANVSPTPLPICTATRTNTHHHTPMPPLFLLICRLHYVSSTIIMSVHA